MCPEHGQASETSEACPFSLGSAPALTRFFDVIVLKIVALQDFALRPRGRRFKSDRPDLVQTPRVSEILGVFLMGTPAP